MIIIRIWQNFPIMKQHFMIMETELPLQGGNNYESF